MARREIALRLACGLIPLTLIFASLSATEVIAADKTDRTFKKPIRNPKLDPLAEQVDLFDAVEAGQVTVRLIPKNASVGNVLIENKTDKALTVKIPDAVAGVSIHSQFANGPAGNNFGAANLGNGNPGGANQGNAPQQLGGGVGAAQGNGPAGANGQGIGQGIGQGFFSIPADRVVSLQFNSVCLEHGKPEPTSSSKYTLVPVSRVSRDPVLHQLLTIVGSGKTDSKSAQAAAWHLANKMSFQELAEKTNTVLGSLTQTPDFSRSQIQAAEELVAKAKQRSADVSSVATAESEVVPDAEIAKRTQSAKN